MFRPLILALAGAVIWSAWPVGAAAQDATPGAASGSVSGRVRASDGSPQQPLILVVPAATARPIDLQRCAGAPDTSFPSERLGAGAVRPDASGNFRVAGLEPGAYLVIAIAPLTEFDPAPPLTVAVANGDAVLDMKAFEVQVGTGSDAAVEFVIATGGDQPAVSGRIRIVVTTYHRENLQAAPDRVVSVSAEPPIPETNIRVASDGSIEIDGAEPGQYTLTITTERGFTLMHDIELTPGASGEINLFFSPPQPGGVSLPATGSGPDDGGTNAAALIAGGGVLVAAAGALAVFVGRGAAWRA